MEESIPQVTNQVKPNEQVEVPEITTQPHGNSKPKVANLKILGIFVGFLILIMISAYIILPILIKTPQQKVSTNQISRPAVSVPKSGIFLTKVDNTKELPLYQYPSLYDIRGVAQYKDKIYVSSYGTLAETDKTGKILIYIDPAKYFCYTDPVIIGDFLYIGCYELDLSQSKKEAMEFPDKIYKIDLRTKEIVKKYSSENGITDSRNWDLYGDGNNIWLATFEGVSLIDTINNQVTQFREALGEKGSHFGVSFILVDTDYVWVYVNANVDSQGGLSLFNKKTKSWKVFGPKELNAVDFNRFDLDFGNNGYYIKKVDGGIVYGRQEDQADGTRTCSMRKYTYETGQFTTITTQTGKGGNIMCDKVFENQFPPNGIRSLYKVDSRGFQQLTSTILPQGYQLNGRIYQAVSQLYGNKRYLLGNASIDILGGEDDFPKVIIPLGKDNVGGNGIPSLKVSDNKYLGFIFDKSAEYAVILQGPCGMMCTTVPLTLVDLKNNKVLKEYNPKQGEININYDKDYLNKYTLIRTDNTLTLLNDRTEKVADIDLLTLNIAPVPFAAGTPTPTISQIPVGPTPTLVPPGM